MEDRKKAITSVIVSDGVEDLSGKFVFNQQVGAFAYCGYLETVRLPASLRKIGEAAFLSCEALVRIDLPLGLIEIGRGAFCYCDKLQTLAIPEGVVDLPRGMCHGCKSLESVSFPSSLKTIGRNAFSVCSSLATINDNALEGVIEIGKQAFYGCSSLTAFDLPPLLKSIEMGTFSECASLSKVELPPSLETIMEAAFSGCHPTLIIDLPETVTNIGTYALKGCCVRLPTSLSVLTNGGDARCLLQGVGKVVMSSNVNLELLIYHANGLPNDVRLDPDLRFRVLYGAPPPLKLHIPEPFFSFDISLGSLTRIYNCFGANALRDSVNSAFEDEVRICADLLRCGRSKLPEEILHNMLPFIYGDSMNDSAIGHVVVAVKKFTMNGQSGSKSGSQRRLKRKLSS